MCSGIVILGHGSRREEANREILELTELVRGAHEDWKISCAFVEFAQPSLEEALEKMYEDGIQKVTIVPMFLTVGNHLHQGLPRRLESFLEKFPMEVVMAKHIGADPILVGLIEKRVNEAGTNDGI